jgi:hypothetical protein
MNIFYLVFVQLHPLIDMTKFYVKVVVDGKVMYKIVEKNKQKKYLQLNILSPEEKAKKKQLSQRLVTADEYVKLSEKEQDFVLHLDLSNSKVKCSFLPVHLKTLNCSNCGIEELGDSVLPMTIKTFICSNNKLKKLPFLPHGLKELICDNNNLTELPELPSTLEYVDCRNNKNLEIGYKLDKMVTKILYDKKEIPKENTQNDDKQNENLILYYKGESELDGDCLEPIEIDFE